MYVYIYIFATFCVIACKFILLSEMACAGFEKLRDHAVEHLPGGEFANPFNFYCRNKTFAKYMISFYSKSLPVQIQYVNPVKLKTKQNSPVKHPKHTFNSVFGRLANSISSFLLHFV
jgi:hypothetical protein